MVQSNQQQQAQQLAALRQRFSTVLSNHALPRDQAVLGTSLQLLMLDLFSLVTSQNLPQGLSTQLSTNNVVFPAKRLSKWNKYVAARIRFLAQDDAKKAKGALTNNQRIKKDLIAAAAPNFAAFFQAADAAIARVTGEAAALVDCSDALDSIYNASTKANNQRKTGKKVEEAVASHKAVVEFEANHDMSLEENQTKLHKLRMKREELSSKTAVCVFDGKTIEQLLAKAIEKHKSMLVPVDPENTDYGPGLDEQRRLFQDSINEASAANKATAKRGADSDDDYSITSDSGGESGMPNAMKMESMSTYTHQPMTVVSTGTSRKIESCTFAFDEDVSETLPNENSSGMSTMKMESFASATRMSSSDEDATSSPLLRKKPFPNENSSNFNVSTAQSSVAFGDSDDSDNEKMHYRRSSTSTKNKSILDSDDEVMPDIESPPMKKRARSANKKRKKLGYKYKVNGPV